MYLGPIQNKMQYERVKGFFSDIAKEDWKVAVGGTNPEGKGYFITPTIIDRPDSNSRIVKEEPFGTYRRAKRQMLHPLTLLLRSNCAFHDV